MLNAVMPAKAVQLVAQHAACVLGPTLVEHGRIREFLLAEVQAEHILLVARELTVRVAAHDKEILVFVVGHGVVTALLVQGSDRCSGNFIVFFLAQQIGVLGDCKRSLLNSVQIKPNLD